MKKLLAISLITLLSIPSFGAIVRSARIDSTQRFLQIRVEFRGGCGVHRFRLNINECAESDPVQCVSRLRHIRNDQCNRLIRRTLNFSLAGLGLNDPYYDDGTLTIFGDRLPNSNQYSRATVRLP